MDRQNYHQSVNSFKQINNSPLNKSQSKNLWTFAKDSRFKKPVVYCDKFYEDKPKSKFRATSMGYGTKIDFTKTLTCSPGVSKYYFKSQIETNVAKKKGYSMSTGRNDIPQKGYIPLEPLKFPSATKYQIKQLYSGLNYTFRKRNKVLDKTMTIESQNNNPGPGCYENPQSLTPSGKYPIGKHKTSRSTFMNFKQSRFLKNPNKVPGPGQYNEINSLSKQGHYPLSKTISSGKRFFDKQRRQVDFEKDSRINKNPGPGSYRLPSQFGHYDTPIHFLKNNKTVNIL